jgi:hypothetical protein
MNIVLPIWLSKWPTIIYMWPVIINKYVPHQPIPVPTLNFPKTYLKPHKMFWEKLAYI